ncbi:MAG: cytochrome c oxidase subunit 3 [Burkholderiaceae bacterium]|nr:cytochrome c oxidase subunit 3 [Burkholderiaceae bacterium]
MQTASESIRFEARHETAQFGMWVFLASEALFFGGLFLAYLYGRSHWPAGFDAAARRTDVVIGSINTAVLLTSSLFVALAVVAARALRPTADLQGEPAAEQRASARRRVAVFLWITAALGVAFLVLKGVEYRKDWLDGLVPGAAFRLGESPGAPPVGAALFFVLYWVMTGLHTVHLTIGVSVLAVFAVGASHDAAWVQPPRIDVAALYWHFVDVVWILLYPLLYLPGRTG